MNEELEVLNQITEKLNIEEINYMISGSIAVNYYSIPRMTRDIDIVVELDKKNINRFIRTLEKDFYLDNETIKEEVVNKGMFNILHRKYFVKVDFIIRKETDFKKTEFLRKQKISIKDKPMWIVTPEDLVIAKLDWARESLSEIQLGDIRKLIKSISDLDWKYINDWIKKLDLKNIYEKLDL